MQKQRYAQRIRLYSGREFEGGFEYTPMIGASGAVFGIMAGFGLLFPNTELMLLFFPFPIKAKYFVTFLCSIRNLCGTQQNAWR